MRQTLEKVEFDLARMRLGDFALFERNQSRNTANAEAGGNRRLLVDIDLGEASTRLKLLRRLVEDRRHRTARPTPGGPEVDDQRHTVALDMLVESLRGQRDRLAGEQVRLAGPAFGLRRGTVGGDAVDPRALGTHNLRRFGHDMPPLPRA